MKTLIGFVAVAISSSIITKMAEVEKNDTELYSVSSTDNATFYHFKTDMKEDCMVIYQTTNDDVFSIWAYDEKGERIAPLSEKDSKYQLGGHIENAGTYIFYNLQCNGKVTLGYGGDRGDNKLKTFEEFRGLIMVVPEATDVRSFNVLYPEEIPNEYKRIR